MTNWDEMFAKEKCDDCSLHLKNEKDMECEDMGIIALDKFLCRNCYEKNKQALINAFEWESGDTDYEETMVCPYCGYKETSAWEYHADEGTLECGRCESTYSYSRDTSITYSTDKI